MNRIKKGMLLLLALAGVTAAQAQQWKVQQVAGQKKVALVIEDYQQGLEARLENDRGQVLARQEITRDDMPGKIFNLNSLPEGNYRLYVTAGLTTTEQSFQILEHGLLMEGATISYAPSIRLINRKLDVSLMNEAEEDVTISIRDDRGEVIFQDDLQEVFKLEKRYDLAQLDRGVYQLVVNTSGKQYYKRIDID